jgi:hypothetical protein
MTATSTPLDPAWVAVLLQALVKAIPGVADLAPNRAAGWRSATALTPVQPTVLVPG